MQAPTTSLEDLIAFNDEVAALAHAGVPIDVGLSRLSRDPIIAGSEINSQVARRVQEGISLEQLFAEEGLFPPIYQSVVQAGLKCGRLPAALDGLSRYARSITEVRQSLNAAMLYPFIVCLLTYALLLWSWTSITPKFTQLFHEFGTRLPWLTRLVTDTMPFWIALPPLLGIIFLYRWSRADAGRLFGLGAWFRPLEWLPVVTRIAADQRRGNTAELLALLVENEVPLPEGLRLATETSGDRRLMRAASRAAEATLRGQQLTVDAAELRGFPPFLRWALTSESDTAGLTRALRLAADTYRQRAQRRTDRLRVVVPVLLTVVIGGGVTLFYCLSVFVPIVSLIQNLT